MIIPKNAGIPKAERSAAIKQFWSVSIRYVLRYLATFPLGIMVALTAKPQQTHPQAKKVTSVHSKQYIDQGSSGKWEYWNSNVKWLQPWNNLEDGLLGEPSGKHSARMKGKERSFWGMYQWICRNAYNWGKRTNKDFFCLVDDCDIVWWGDEVVSDKVKGPDTWHLVKATDRKTGKVYYCFRSIKNNADGSIGAITFGFKIKPQHRGEDQDADDEDKAFTMRWQMGAKID